MIKKIFKIVILIVIMVCGFGYITHREPKKPTKKHEYHRHGRLKVVFGG